MADTTSETHRFMVLFWDVFKLRIATGKREKDEKRVESSPERINQSRCCHTQFEFIFFNE